MYTIREERGSITGIIIALIRDQTWCTVHSLAKILVNYQVRIIYISPPSLGIPRSIWDYVCHNIEQMVYSDFEEVINCVDVLYITRIQKERSEDIKEFEAIKSSYVISARTLTRAKSDVVIMHPLPRLDEIANELDNDPRSAYFRQMEYGLYVRMAYSFRGFL